LIGKRGKGSRVVNEKQISRTIEEGKKKERGSFRLVRKGAHLGGKAFFILHGGGEKGEKDDLHHGENKARPVVEKKTLRPDLL